LITAGDAIALGAAPLRVVGLECLVEAESALLRRGDKSGGFFGEGSHAIATRFFEADRGLR
jgi:hypothetical protein